MIAALATLMAGAYVVYHGTPDAPDKLGAGLSTERRAAIRWQPAAALLTEPPAIEEAAVLIADAALLEHFGELRDLPGHVVIVAADVASAIALGERADVVLARVDEPVARSRLFDAACRLADSRLEVARMKRQLDRTDDEFSELCRIVTALMHERDRTALLNVIVTFGKGLTESDGGGVLLVERDEPGPAQLRPVVFRLDSLPDVQIPTVSFPVGNKSMVGYAAYTREPVVVADAEALPPGSTFVANAEFRQQHGYPARSMLAVPMITQRDEVLGVVFFINRKTDPHVSIMPDENANRYIVPFTDRHVRLARSLASIAAVTIENARLYESIEHILESLVKASVTAIDARDPTTAGHSVRVAALTIGLAEAVQRAGRGRYHGVQFTQAQMRELRFAALLHDIGKVAVREDVLFKTKKLPPALWERVDSRFALIRRTLELEYYKRRADECRAGATEPQRVASLEAHLAEQLRELDRLREVVGAANEPSVTDQSQRVELTEIAKRTFEIAEGRTLPYLTPDELRYLQLARGTLDEGERAEIESHVDKTNTFLERIPWTDDLKNLTRYASGHHEKLDGTGYPKGLTQDEIPIETRMITLADMFDALTANDRPYKPAVSAERALEIIRADADAGLLDRDLVDILTESQVYKKVLEKDWRRL
jgi:HD-GYP domain-containing protein (c-di-GMP phosphodiesterase class II)